jgi:hypothetical protein
VACFGGSTWEEPRHWQTIKQNPKDKTKDYINNISEIDDPSKKYLKS